MSSSASAEFHCWYAGDQSTALAKGRYVLSHYESFLRPGPIFDIGCGEGALLLALRDKGWRDVSGVDSNPELCELAASFGLPIVRADLGEYLRRTPLKPSVYFYIDVIEHVPFDFNLTVMESLPRGSRLIIQTPYTKSVLGHQYYLNVPSHLSPYSPWVIARMLNRAGYDVVAEGSLEGHHTDTWQNRLRSLIIRKVLGIDPELLLGGGNYFVVADKHSEERK